MKRNTWRQRCCLFICMLLLVPGSVKAQGDYVIRLCEQQQTIAAGTAGDVYFELYLEGFRDYGMEIGVEWLGGDGETTADAPQGVHFAGGNGAPTDKMLHFSVAAQARAGTYAFRVVVDDQRGSVSTLTISPAQTQSVHAPSVGEPVKTQAVFEDAAAQPLRASVETVESGAYFESVCAQAQVEAQDASLYQLHLYDESGNELESLEEKVYVYLPVDDAPGADVYAVGGQTQDCVGTHMSETELRIAVKEAGDYLVVCP